jgi:uncharacterized alpha-E superfamily protein
MLSRVADNLYWLGRYLQRAENTARLVNVNSNLLLDLPRGANFSWASLADIVGASATFHNYYQDNDETSVCRFLLTDERNPGSILSSLTQAREVLRVSRDTVPREAWERLNDVYLLVQQEGSHAESRAKRQAFLNNVINGMLLLYGVLTSNMSRDVGFQFMRLGTNLEQADMTTRIVDVRATQLLDFAQQDQAAYENVMWMAVLKSLTAYQMYRRHTQTRVSGAGVLRFLLQNRDFPRSTAYCLQLVSDTLPKLPPARAFERSLERTRALVLDANVDQLIAYGLHERIDDIQVGLGQMHQALTESYFKS